MQLYKEAGMPFPETDDPLVPAFVPDGWGVSRAQARSHWLTLPCCTWRRARLTAAKPQGKRTLAFVNKVDLDEAVEQVYQRQAVTSAASFQAQLSAASQELAAAMAAVRAPLACSLPFPVAEGCTYSWGMLQLEAADDTGRESAQQAVDEATARLRRLGTELDSVGRQKPDIKVQDPLAWQQCS